MCLTEMKLKMKTIREKQQEKEDLEKRIDEIAEATEEKKLPEILDQISFNKGHMTNMSNYRTVDGAIMRCQDIYNKGKMTYAGFRNLEQLYSQYDRLYRNLRLAEENPPIPNKYKDYMIKTFYSGNGMGKLRGYEK